MNNAIISADPRILAMWESWIEEQGESTGFMLARITEQNHHLYTCLEPEGQKIRVRISGGYESRGRNRDEYPVVGDWVAVSIPKTQDSQTDEAAGLISHVLPRSSSLSRAAAGIKTEKQIIVSNIDYVLLVFGLDGGRNFLESMLERSLTAAWNSGAKPVIVLNKADAASPEDRDKARAAAEGIAFGVPVFVVSAHSMEGMEDLAAEIAGKGQYPPLIAMLGKSGVGKSALVNALHRIDRGDRQSIGGGEPASASPFAPSVTHSGASRVAAEGAQRKGDNQGRHTTTASRLYPLPFGPWIADVPGLRELKIWGDEDDLAQVFPEIVELAEQCRFRDCRHDAEPGCAVRQAMEAGELDPRRFESWQKLQKELAYLDRRNNEQAIRAERDKWKAINKSMRNFRKPGR